MHIDMTDRSERGARDWDFGGILRIHADQDYPYLQMKWQSWKAGPANHDLQIAKGEASKNWVLLEANRAICDGTYQIRSQDAIYEVGADRIICQGPVNENFLEHEVVIPVINRMAAKKGHYLAYASAVSHKGKIIIFPGISGSGKTSVILEFLMRGASYIGNNHTFIDRKGTCTLYSPMIGFKERNAAMFPELVAGLSTDEKERRMQEKRLSFHQLGTSINARNFVTRYIRDQFVSRFYFLQEASYDRLFPRCEVPVSGPVAHAFLLERGMAEPRVIEAASEDLAKLATTSDWVYSGNGGNCHNALAEAVGLDFCTKADYQSVFADFFAHARCHRVRIPPQATRETIRKTVDEIERIVG